jgi:hypothetical protein
MDDSIIPVDPKAKPYGLKCGHVVWLTPDDEVAIDTEDAYLIYYHSGYVQAWQNNTNRPKDTYGSRD